MVIYKISYSKQFKRANIHNYGCNFNCAWCSYKLQKRSKPDKFLKLDKIKKILSKLDIERVHFVGGELSTYPLLNEVAEFAKKELGLYTKIGHSNGYVIPNEYIDAISVSIKSLSDDFYIKHTGKSNKPVLENFKEAYKMGINVDASSVYIPNLVEHDEIEKIVKFIAQIDPKIPYHITGYIPVPGAPWRAPSWDEIRKAKSIAEEYLDFVEVSWFHSFEDYLKMINENPHYQKITIA